MFAEDDDNNIYHQTQPVVKMVMEDDHTIKFDEYLQYLGKINSHSLYGNDFQNWGKLDKKLVLKRPIEKYYKLKFRGNTTFATEQQKVIKHIDQFRDQVKEWQ